MKNSPIFKKKEIYGITMIGLVFTLLTACISPQKLLETGSYDAAVYKSVDKLIGKKKKEKYVNTLEEAFYKATNRDMASIKRLKNGTDPNKWEKIHHIAKQIEARQKRVAPLLPLIARNGLKADFNFVKVTAIEQEARANAAKSLYEQAIQSLKKGGRGDKIAARKAYEYLKKIGSYYPSYRDRDELMKRAKDLGTAYVLIRMENSSRAILPRDFEQEMTQLDTRGMNSFWTAYYTEAARNIKFDYEAVLEITRLEVSSGQIREREFEESKEIQDGFEYVLDQNGNVAKDTLGNDIKRPKNVVIRAAVLESYQTKFAKIEARLEFRELHTRNLISSERLNADAVFENYASTFRGDKRALSQNTCERIGNRPLPFPSDASLIFEAGEQLKPVFKSKVKRVRV